MTAIKQVHSVVTQFLGLLAQASTVVVDGPVLSTWETDEPTGEESNEVVRFSWEDQDDIYVCKLTEGGIAAGHWSGESFLCADHEGNDVRVFLYKQVAITPSTRRED